jgi:hypothetical protein
VLRCVVAAVAGCPDATMLVIRCTVTMVAWFTAAQPTAGADWEDAAWPAPGPEDAAWPAA